MSKALVFISHTSAEKEVAIAFKDLIESYFIGMIELFVSSDDSSIGLGQKWLDKVTDALKTCVVEIVICSPKSVCRPWINFEAGAGWIRGIPVIPLCHSGMEPNDLPVPLNLLQAAKATEASSLKPILPVLAEAIGSRIPNVDFTDFINNVKEFEVNYLFWDKCNAAFEELNTLNTQIIPALKQGKSVEIEIQDTQIKLLNSFLNENNILQFEPKSSIHRYNGIFYKYILSPMSNLHKIITDKKFKF